MNDDDDVDKMVVVAHTPHLSVRTPHLSVRTSRLLCLLFGGTVRTVRKNGAKKKNCYHDNDADYSDGDDDEREDSQGTVSTHSPIIILLLTHHHHHHHHPIHPSIIIIIHLKIYMFVVRWRASERRHQHIALWRSGYVLHPSIQYVLMYYSTVGCTVRTHHCWLYCTYSSSLPLTDRHVQVTAAIVRTQADPQRYFTCD